MTDNFEHYNPSPDFKPLKNGKMKQWKKKDDLIRAVCCATGKTWSDVINLVMESAKQKNDNPDSEDTVSLVMETIGYHKVSLGKMKKGTSRPTLSEFALDHKNETCIVKTPNYYACVKDGKVYDALDSTSFKVFSWYTDNNE